MKLGAGAACVLLLQFNKTIDRMLQYVSGWMIKHTQSMTMVSIH
jgi:hypothetical protein